LPHSLQLGASITGIRHFRLEHTTFSAHTSYLNEGRWEVYGFRAAELGTFRNGTHLLPGSQKATRWVEDVERYARAAVVVEGEWGVVWLRVVW